MSEEKKIVELKDDELEKVTGGGFDIGDRFLPSDAYEDYIEEYGTWFCDYSVPEFIYNVCHAGHGNVSFTANKYWYNNGEAWNCGTCTIGPGSILNVTNPPKTVHNDFTGTKPF